jgi:hypothetical protein
VLKAAGGVARVESVLGVHISLTAVYFSELLHACLDTYKLGNRVIRPRNELFTGEL